MSQPTSFHDKIFLNHVCLLHKSFMASNKSPILGLNDLPLICLLWVLLLKMLIHVYSLDLSDPLLLTYSYILMILLSLVRLLLYFFSQKPIGT